MRKRWIAMFLAVALSAAANAQSVEELFLKMPEKDLIWLDEEGKKKLIEEYETSTDTVAEEPYIAFMTDDVLRLEGTKSSTMTLWRLPMMNRTYMICRVMTLLGPAQDSRVDFFTTDWEPLPSEGILPEPEPEDFLIENADTTSEDYREIRAASDMKLLRYWVSEDEEQQPILGVMYTTPMYFNKEMSEKAEQFYGKNLSKIYVWENGRFEEATLYEEE